MSTYESRWDYDAQDGDQGELFARWAADGLKSGASLEVKTDRASWASGKVYIEFECFVSGQWMPSGVHEKHTQAELWAHVIVGPMVLFAPTEYVRWVARKHGERKEMPKSRSSHPTRGYVIKIPKFAAELVQVALTWANDDDHPSLYAGEDDPAAPFGRDARGIPVAPYGYTKDRKVRLNPGGRRANQPVAPALWGEPGASRTDEKPYEPLWGG
jgi:hypothetical protein